jgi:ferrochelatase
MRHWRPYIRDTLAAIAANGGRRAIGFIAAAHHCYASCTQYKEHVARARRAMVQAGQPDVAVTYADSWFNHELLIRAWAQRVSQALARIETITSDQARLIFTAHSLPRRMAEACQYCQQLAETSRLVAQAVGRTDWALVYQSRSGPSAEPWLEPDICDYLVAEQAEGLRAAVLVPIGFVSDHMEVLYDLDHRAAALCQQHDLPMVRAETLNDHPLLLDMMAELVAHTYHHHRNHLPLPIYCPL